MFRGRNGSNFQEEFFAQPVGLLEAIRPIDRWRMQQRARWFFAASRAAWARTQHNTAYG